MDWFAQSSTMLKILFVKKKVVNLDLKGQFRDKSLVFFPFYFYLLVHLMLSILDIIGSYDLIKIFYISQQF